MACEKLEKQWVFCSKVWLISPGMTMAIAHHLTSVLIVLVTCATTHLLTAFFLLA